MNSDCSSCHKKKNEFECQHCHSHICKSCVHFLDEESFSFLAKIPEQLKHQYYCDHCYNQVVAPELEKYSELMQKAQDINVFEKSQGKETRLIKRTEKAYVVNNCKDRDETILRLAFLAAQNGFNSIIDTDLVSKKIRKDSYQTTIWSGTAIPANVSENRLVKDRSIWSNPN